MAIEDFQPNIRLPASGDCWGVNVISREEHRIPAAQCAEMMKRSVFMDSENWKKVKKSFLKNCQKFQCKQIAGAFDELFLTIDEALRSMPIP